MHARPQTPSEEGLTVVPRSICRKVSGEKCLDREVRIGIGLLRGLCHIPV